MSIVLKNSLIVSCLVSTSILMTACSVPKNSHSNQGKALPKKYQNNVPTYYTVRLGDTLSQIASRFGLDYRRLGALNGLDSDYTIKVGQRLRLTQPNNVVVPPLTTAQQPKYTTQNLPQMQNYPTQPVNTVTTRPIALPNTQPIINTNTWLPPVRGNLIQGFDEKIGTRGVWFSAINGSPVTASKDGTVIYVGEGLPEYGKLIMISHADDYITAYAHLEAFHVSENQIVKAGQQIGSVGFAPFVNQPAVEFQIRYKGTPINPVNMLK